MKIGILQCGHLPGEIAARTGDYDALYARMLDGHGFDIQSYAVVDGQFPEDAGAADGWVVTGSRHGAYEDLPWIPPLEDLIRDISARGLPLVGICFGHQIIAQALGGKVEKFKGGWAVGQTEYRIGGRTLVLNAWHQDQVTERPEGARVLGSSDFCENAVLAYGDNVWTIQPHPEFDSAIIDDLIRTRGRGMLPEALLDIATERLDQPDDNDEITEFIAGFLRKGRA